MGLVSKGMSISKSVSISMSMSEYEYKYEYGLSVGRARQCAAPGVIQNHHLRTVQSKNAGCQ